MEMETASSIHHFQVATDLRTMPEDFLHKLLLEI